MRTPWPETLGARELERLPDRRQPERLAGVDRDVEVRPADRLEGVEITGRRISLLGAGDIEPDDAGVAPADRAFGDLDGASRLAHRGDEQLHHDRVAGLGGACRADPEAVEHRGGGLVEGQALLGAQLGRHPDLGVDHAVGSQVLGAFGRDAGDRVGPLHDPERMRKSLEVELEALAVGATSEPGSEVVDVGGRERVVAVLGCQIDDRGRPQSPIEMVVEERLGRLRDRCVVQHRPMVRGRSIRRDEARPPVRRGRVAPSPQ